jgi:UDPglucose 6-dehydrogenase
LKIGVFGTGYVGLVAGVCFADSGNTVISVDIDERKVQALQQGIVPIYEPGVEELLKSALKAKRIEFTTDPKVAVDQADVLFIAVGTPENEDGSADLSRVLDVARTIAQRMNERSGKNEKNEKKVVVIKSTVPVGTADRVADVIRGITEVPCEVVSNPEFLKEGASVQDFLKPDRVVIGCKTDRARKVMSELYGPFVRSGKPILFMSNRAAELSKYAANAFLATKISFINELALLADEVGADIEDVKKGFTSDARINPAFFYPGVGYGGSCFPKDVKALAKMGDECGVGMSVVKATEQANDNQKLILVRKIKKHFGDLKGKTLALWGLSFKPRTDDVREAPSFALIERLLSEGVGVRAYDPAALSNARANFRQRVSWAETAYDALAGADGLVVVTEWNEFRTPDFERVRGLLRNPVIFDGRNVFDPTLIRKLGFEYYCVGREVVGRVEAVEQVMMERRGLQQVQVCEVNVNESALQKPELLVSTSATEGELNGRVKGELVQ